MEEPLNEDYPGRIISEVEAERVRVKLLVGKVEISLTVPGQALRYHKLQKGDCFRLLADYEPGNINYEHIIPTERVEDRVSEIEEWNPDELRRLTSFI